MDDISAHIAVICRDAMGIPDLGVHENLVARGADSIVAVEVVSRIELDYRVSVADLFSSAPTIEALATAVHSQLQQQR